MIAGLSLSKVGLVLALIYAAIAIWVVFTERTGPAGGGWITLNGMASYLITLPVSAPLELMGAKPDYQKTLHIGAAILICTIMVYWAGAGAEWLVRQLLTTNEG